MERKGQIEVTFNWIYIVIAGAVILLFFTGIIIKQKAASEERLAVDVVNILESIFSGAEVSENTKNFVETGALADEILYFSCQDGIGEYGLQGYDYGVQNTVDPIFSPAEIKSPLLILWSLPYYLPFKVMDFLIVTSSNTKYYFIKDGSPFEEQLDLAMGEQDQRLSINHEFISFSELSQIKQGNNFQVRLVFLNEIDIDDIPTFLEIDRLTAVVFSNAGIKITYYKRGENRWELIDSADIISLDDQDRDAAKIAAIFAENGEMYKCNMEKAFKRLSYLIQVYGKENADGVIGGKLGELKQYYEEAIYPNCQSSYYEGITVPLYTLKHQVDNCVFESYNSDSCKSLDNTAADIAIENEKLDTAVSCTRLY